MAGVMHDGKGWSNADQDRVERVAYDPSWPAQYEAEAGAIRAALAGLADFEPIKALGYVFWADNHTEGKARYEDDLVRRAGNP